MVPALPPDDVLRLREALLAVGFTVDGVTGLLGDVAHRALARDELVPALRATRGGSPLETLLRVFLLGRGERVAAVASALAPLPLDRAVAGRLVHRTGDRVSGAVDLRPYAETAGSTGPGGETAWWVVSDPDPAVRGGGPLRPDHVIGVGGASLTLASAVLRSPVRTAVDLGTGGGVQALHLSGHATAVTATDRNPRALAFARLTAALSGVEPPELVEGDLLEPLTGRRVDLLVSNPPFVIGPSGRYLYRDSGLPGDELSRRLVGAAPDVLADGGVAQLLASWLHVRGEDWHERVSGWLPAGCDAWVVQREVQDPAEHVALWLRDSGDSGSTAAYDVWLDALEREQVEGIGFGLVTLRRTGAAAPTRRVEELRDPLASLTGDAAAGWLAAVATLRTDDDRLLATRLRAAPDVRLEQLAAAGEDGWAVQAQALRQLTGLHRRAEIDEVGAAVVAGCTGAVPLRDLLAVLAAAYDVALDDLVTGALPAVRGLVEQGFLLVESSPARV